MGTKVTFESTYSQKGQKTILWGIENSEWRLIYVHVILNVICHALVNAVEMNIHLTSHIRLPNHPTYMYITSMTIH